MFEGSDKVDASSCKTLKPASGFDGQTKMIFVRNPSYDATTDSKAARENLPDEFDFVVNTNADDIYNKVKAGDLDDELSSPTPKVIREYVTNKSLRPMLHLNASDSTNYITMNLTQPPFDDVHVRRAMNFAMDKTAMIQGLGGSTIGELAGHIAPDALLGDKLKGYDPYKSAGGHGDVDKAKAEMKLSKYDTNKDGICDAPQCNNVLMIADARAADKVLVPILQSGAGKIGILFQVNVVNGAYPVIQDVSKNTPISDRPRWGKDYGDALTFFEPLFKGANIIPKGNTNYSLVGITPAIAKKTGAKGTIKGVPTIDPQLDACSVLSGDARLACYAKIDQTLMTTVVPWIPYVWRFQQHITGPKVAKWGFDQFSAGTAYAHVAVK
jgi:peptide/nickel transport system substrate-binding protein